MKKFKIMKSMAQDLVYISKFIRISLNFSKILTFIDK